MGNRKGGQKLLLAGAVLVTLAIAVLSLCLGNIHFLPTQLPAILNGSEGTVNRSILLYARLPRTLAALSAGAALAVSGAVLQNVLANRLASPGIIGVNAGAGLGVTLCCAVGILSGPAVSAGAFAGSLVSVICIFLFSCWINASRTTVILCGVAMNSILNAVCESITVLDTDLAMLSIDFRVWLAGAAVSFAGLLGFVGLIVPHFVRRLTGNESAKLLPLCAVSGGGFVMLCDLVSRLLFAPYELPVGILMSVAGGPVFLFLLARGGIHGTGGDHGAGGFRRKSRKKGSRGGTI